MSIIKADYGSRAEIARSVATKQLIGLFIGLFLGLCLGLFLHIAFDLHLILVAYIAVALATFFKGLNVCFSKNFVDGRVGAIILLVLLIGSPLYTIYVLVRTFMDLTSLKVLISSGDELSGGQTAQLSRIEKRYGIHYKN